MSILNFNRSSENKWNYSDPNAEGYMPSVTGTVVEITTPQSINFKTKQLETWPDGSPKLNVALTIQGQSGREVVWTFQPSKNSNAMQAVHSALVNALGEHVKGIQEILGLNITVSTKEPPQGFSYGQQNPRPWSVVINGQGNQAAVRGVFDTSTNSAAKAPAATPMNQEQQQPMQAQPMNQTQQPTAVDVAMNNAMQASGFAPQQPVQGQQYTDPTDLLYEDIPF